MGLVGYAIRNARLTLSIMVFLLIAGALAYQSVPKEAEPDVQIPIMYVSLVYQGISPEDAERLLLRPMETKLKSSARASRRCARPPIRAAATCWSSSTPATNLATALRGRAHQGAGRQGATCRRAPTSRRSTRSTSRNSRCWW